ncbi:Non-structural maintenance of chromosome element 4 C-terminal [Trinorchestia longiramus]|nr:Non-structural maintenance of chromosome element 4 C-terminal [Trinorchestia longiramus]
MYRLGSHCNKALRRCHGVEPQYVGAAEKVPRAQAVRQSKVKDKESARTEMKKVLSTQGEEMQTEEVSRIYGILKKRFRENGNKPVCFFSFIVNPHSFVATIENTFHTSFLIRDQHALITSDANGLQLIAPDKPTPGQTSHSSFSKQTEVSFDVKTFEECIRVFKIKEPMIPPRGSTNGS